MRRCFDGLYAGRRVLLTGHTGFKGSWLALWLAELGAEVHGYALSPPTEPSLFDEAGVIDVLASHTLADVRDAQALRDCLQEVQPEMVFHLAAQPLVRLSYDEPVETYATNVMGTVHLLDAVRHTDSVRVCQIITSDKCYENHEWHYGYRENDPMGGHDPYSNSKGCAELVTAAFRNSYFQAANVQQHGVGLSSVRAGNVIGGGDWALDRIIPDCIRALEAGQPIQVRNPHAIRPWQHVLDPLSGYLWLAACQFRQPGRFEEGWNFGPGGAGNVPVSQIADHVIRHWGSGEWTTDAPDTPAVHEAHYLKLDITKARDVLGWNPVWGVDAAVRETVDWYRARHEGADIRQLTREQIRHYAEAGQRAGEAWALPESQA